ncbi:uncharacterized protein N7482_000100 [Penicillium canariense]|uniref:Alcohol dehydrogenase-like C-terminal domain-containing protein n=1 Tax=Penicillium canariense TaxID=189055 RepID=A0A9W9ICP2_9EURO|nr:uncharacterized protein N7482_000100 [Penicillium canariense]KAJ5174223.1 hypothetical protein N7482_000100 [Penicillium canariense]
MHNPEFLSFEESASLGVWLATVVQVLYPVMKLPLPSPHILANSGPALLVYGGSSATGTIAIQVAKLSGCRVYATCSAANNDLVMSRGAEKWFDYNQLDFVEQIEAAGLSITHIVDCIGTEESGIACSKILALAGGHYHSIRVPCPESFKERRPEDTALATTALGYTMFGERFEFPGVAEYPAEPAMEEFAKKWVLVAEELVKTGKVQPHPLDIRGGGLEGLLQGLQEMRTQAPRGKKIVYSREWGLIEADAGLPIESVTEKVVCLPVAINAVDRSTFT